MQLPLEIHLPDSATFSNLVTGRNGEAIEHVRRSLCGVEGDHSAIFIWGGEGSGKSHILQACCQLLVTTNQSAVYLPLPSFNEPSDNQLDPAMLEGLESLALVCIDDIDRIAGDDRWESALFNLYNRMHGGRGQLIMAANAAPVGLAIKLADLQSRLTWGWVFQLQLLNDEEKKQALQLRARTRGLELSGDVCDYLLRNFPRDTTALFNLLDRLDTASMIEQRRLTVPFVKSVLNQ